MTTRKGYSHINLATTDIEATRDFYEGVLGFPVLSAGIYRIEEGGHFRHIHFDIGEGQLLSFLEPNDLSGIPSRFETDINSPLGLPPVFYHVAFEAGSLEELRTKRESLMQKGVPVTDVVDHDWSHSIYFDDPVNGLKLEYSCITRDLRERDAEMAVRLEMPMQAVRSMMSPGPA